MPDSLCREASRCPSANFRSHQASFSLLRLRRSHSPSNRADRADPAPRVPKLAQPIRDGFDAKPPKLLPRATKNVPLLSIAMKACYPGTIEI
jgi:hypothetical protein